MCSWLRGSLNGLSTLEMAPDGTNPIQGSADGHLVKSEPQFSCLPWASLDTSRSGRPGAILDVRRGRHQSRAPPCPQRYSASSCQASPSLFRKGQWAVVLGSRPGGDGALPTWAGDPPQPHRTLGAPPGQAKWAATANGSGHRHDGGSRGAGRARSERRRLMRTRRTKRSFSRLTVVMAVRAQRSETYDVC